MDEKNKKKIIIFLILIIVILLGALGYLIYDNYLKTEEPKEKQEVKVEETNYYTADYLLEKGYIKEASSEVTTKKDCSNYDGFSGDEDIDYLYNEQGKYYIQYCQEESYENYSTKNKALEMPNVNIVKGYYNFVCGQMCTKEIILMDDQNSIYYSSLVENWDTAEDDYESFKNYKIENVKNIYVSTYDKPWAYYDNEFRSTIILEMSDGTLKTLKANGNNIELVNLSETRPYFDYICAQKDPICNETMMYITFDNKLVPNYNLNDIIKNDKGEEIIIKDAFTAFEITSDGQMGNVVYDFDFTFEYTIYVLDQNNNLYKAELDRNKIDSKNPITMTLYKENVKEISYQPDENNYFVDATIKYNDGKEEMIKKVETSTIYERNNK